MQIDTSRAIQRLLKFQKDVQEGRIVLPSALGPNSISKNSIKAKTIRGVQIDASTLESITTRTGSLDITGDLTMSGVGAIKAGKSAYSDNINDGYWIGLDSAVPKINIGNSTYSLKWDGNNLTITGAIVAASGTIGGWSIGATDLTADSGATGMASSGSYRFWTGNATPASAPFSISSAGALVSTSGSIGGWTIDASGLRLGSGATQRGLDTGSTAFYAGSATPGSAPFRVSTAGALVATSVTLTGAITASSLSLTGTFSFSGGSVNLPGSGSLSGSALDINSATFAGITVDGTITIGSGGKIIDADGSFWDQNGITLISSGSAGDVITWKNGATNLGFVYASSTTFFVEAHSSKILSMSGASMSLNSLSTDISAFSARHIDFQLGDAAGVDQWKLRDSGGVQVWGINSDGELVRPITNDSTAEGTYFGRIPIYINGSLKYISVHNA